MSDVDRAHTDEPMNGFPVVNGQHSLDLLDLWNDWQAFEDDGSGMDFDAPPPDEAETERALREVHTRVVEPLPSEIEFLSDKSRFMYPDPPSSRGRDLLAYNRSRPIYPEPLSPRRRDALASLRDAFDSADEKLHLYAFANRFAEYMKVWQQNELNYLHLRKQLWEKLREQSPVLLLVGDPTFPDDLCGIRAESPADRYRRAAVKSRFNAFTEGCRLTEERSTDPYWELRYDIKRYLQKRPPSVLHAPHGPAKDPRAELETLVQRADTFTTAVGEDGRFSLVIGLLGTLDETKQASPQPPAYAAVLELPGGPGPAEHLTREGNAKAPSTRHTLWCAPRDPAQQAPLWRFPADANEFEAGLQRARTAMACL